MLTWVTRRDRPGSLSVLSHRIHRPTWGQMAVTAVCPFGGRSKYTALVTARLEGLMFNTSRYRSSVYRGEGYRPNHGLRRKPQCLTGNDGAIRHDLESSCDTRCAFSVKKQIVKAKVGQLVEMSHEETSLKSGS